MRPDAGARLATKPTYRTTRRWNWISFWLSWAIIIAIVVAAIRGSQEAVQLAPVLVPSLCVMIAALSGIHRVTGAMDFKSSMEAAATEVQ
jgi:steroid 5-alpha reductase family enzyme